MFKLKLKTRKTWLGVYFLYENQVFKIVDETQDEIRYAWAIGSDPEYVESSPGGKDAFLKIHSKHSTFSIIPESAVTSEVLVNYKFKRDGNV